MTRALDRRLLQTTNADAPQGAGQQRLTIDQAIAAYTTGSAFAEFEEKDKGKLVPGMLADFVVLDRDVTAVAPEKILATKVLLTVVGGKTVYAAK